MSNHKFMITLAGLVAVPIMASAQVSAQDSNCTITNTGPNSNNTCTTDTSYKCSVTNETVVIVDNNNNQVAESGNTSSTGNTTGGGATSGSATNENGTRFDFTVTNGGCAVTAVTPPAPVIPAAPVNGMGAVTGTTPQPAVRAASGAGAVVPTALPNTGSVSPLAVAIGIFSLGAVALTIARLRALHYGA